MKTERSLVFGLSGLTWRGRLALLVVPSLLLLSGPASAGPMILEFTSLPSAQGWVYQSGNSATEASVFSVGDNALHQNTMGVPYDLVGGVGNFYALNGVVQPLLPFTLSVTARVLEEEFNPGTSFPFGFGFGVNSGVEVIAVVLGTARIGIPSGGLLSHDNAQYHDYVLQGSFGPNGGYRLFVDNILLATGPPSIPESNPGTGNTLLFGDLGAEANARADISSYSFSQPVIPEPISLLLIGSGLSLAAFASRRQRR